MARVKMCSVNRFAKQVVAIVCITLLGCIYIQQSHLLPRQIYPGSAEPITDECRPQSRIVFLKAHKCASSTIQNIFMRYGYFNDKVFVLPPKGNYLGHPEPFSRKLVPKPAKFGGNYSILTHHTRLNYSEMNRLIPNALFVTIIRNPVNLFESMFQYYKLQKMWKVDFSSFNNASFAIPDRIKTQRFAKRIGINQMMFDLGLEPEYFYDDKRIAQYINQLDSIFSLVMVSEKMEESLILLKNLLCWDYEDMVVFKLNARNVSYRNPITDVGLRRIRQLNRADQKLYEHFTKKFDRAVERFGRQRMAHEVSRLRAKTKFYYNYCVGQTVTQNNSQIVRFVNVKKYNPVCKFLTNSELSLTNFIRSEQMKRFPGSVFANHSSSTISITTTAN